MKHLLLLVVLVIIGAQAQGQPVGHSLESPLTSALGCARWRVEYIDRELGLVVGDAVVDWKHQRATVTLLHGGRPHVLVSEDFQVPTEAEPFCRIRFKGSNPALSVSARTVPVPELLGVTGETRIELGSNEARFEVAQPERAEDSVTVYLSIDDEGDLRGRWSYRADPVTWRNASGGGRTGQYTPDPPSQFGGQQSGSEVWLQKRPDFEHIVVLENQQETPHYRIGDSSQDPKPVIRILTTPREPTPNRWTSNRQHRTLFVVGYNLPTVPGLVEDTIFNTAPVVSESDDVTYTFLGLARRDDPQSVDLEAVGQGWHLVNQERKSKVRETREPKLVGALIEANLAKDYLPGVKVLKWNGQELKWRLESRDSQAELQFVRQIGDEMEWESTGEGYVTENLKLSLRSEAPYRGFRVQVQAFELAGGQTTRALGPARELIAEPVKERAKWHEELPKGQLFRTREALTLLRPGTTGPGLAVSHGAIVIAHATPIDGLLSAPATAELKVVVPPKDAEEIWSGYVARAVRAHGLDPGNDPRSFQTRQAARFSKTLIVLLERLKVNATYGSHAAALLLRDEFVRSLKQREIGLAQVAESKDNNAALGYTRLTRQVLQRTPEAPVGKLRAGSLRGRTVTLAEALSPAFLDREFWDDAEGRDAWLASAARTAISEFRPKLIASAAAAESILDQDLEGLLKLTGHGFRAVTTGAMARLMRYDADTQTWQVDRAARAQLDAVAGKYDELEAAQTAADIDTTLVVGAASAVFLPAAFSQSASAYGIAAAGNGILWAASTGSEFYETWKAKEEVAFAFGASPVLGDERFQEAVLAEPSWERTFAAIGFNTVFFGLQIKADIKKLGLARQLARGTRIAEGTTTSTWGLSHLESGAQRDFAAFLAHARSLAAQKKPLTGLQMSVLNSFSALADAAAKNPEAVSGLLVTVRHLREAREAVDARILQAVAAEMPREVQATLKAQREALLDLWQRAERQPLSLGRVTSEELQRLAGKPDAARARQLVTSKDMSWHHLKDAYMAGEVSPLDMYNFVSYREVEKVRLLEEAIKDVATAIERETGKRPNLTWKALGSTNLTSDLDFSVYGEGAERVVRVFNEKFRALPHYRGLESGFVFDTNVYTQAVYELFSRDVLKGSTLGIANADLDALRQLMYERMATRKYSGGAEAWGKQTAALLAAAPDETTRAMFKAISEEADYAYRSARSAIAKRMGVAGESALKAVEDSNAFLRANTDAYIEVLGDIDQWRTEMKRLQQLTTKEKIRLPNAPPKFLERYPGWRNDWKEVSELAAKGKIAEFAEKAATCSDRLAYQLRRKQGEALFFASEAYQDEWTILHVVKDLQEFKRGKEITFAKLVGGESTRASRVLSRNDARGGLNSMMENLANMRKELGHASDSSKAATKGGKYFIRVLDAGHESGINVKDVVGTDLILQTIGVDKRRKEVADVVKFLAESNTSGDAYVQSLVLAHEKLGAEMVRHKDMVSFAQRVKHLFEEVPSAGDAARKGFDAVPLPPP